MKACMLAILSGVKLPMVWQQSERGIVTVGWSSDASAVGYLLVRVVYSGQHMCISRKLEILHPGVQMISAVGLDAGDMELVYGVSNTDLAESGETGSPHDCNIPTDH
ncbi:uncharacterized protein EI90DRAFT_3029349 [Cantharellus anzutake]|uniref:uncharacterized protein n=1 Tax=Cantharellus anzutake TaxID=1750568 RepID=UPI001907EFB0|nr:uncharacterized protein EI90DRAFT_3029349 [Cantharellus anzutake]KAF8344347.1 hypothetical protein EI90DRAFT_3029349 [Cantharellus anzutake]